MPASLPPPLPVVEPFCAVRRARERGAPLPRWRAMAGRGAGALCAALALVAGAAAAEHDLCVRGQSLEFSRTIRLQLVVDGGDAGALAARLGAALANRVLWKGQAEEVHAAPYDPQLCSAALEEARRLVLKLAPAQAAELQAAAAAPPDAAGLARLVERLEPALLPVLAAKSRRPAPAGQPYVTLRVYYATDRNEKSQSGVRERFGGDRGRLAFGAVHVTIPREHKLGALEAPSILKLEFRENPEKHVTLASLEPLDAATWRAEIARRASAMGRPGVLLFIHGYNVSFADAALRTGQLAYDLAFAGPTVLFSWPSRASVVDYTVDEQSAEWAVTDMKQVLSSLAGLADGAPIYVIAHSMGNRVLTRGFKAMLDEDPARRAAFSQIILAAPDIDADVFVRDIGPSILGKGPRVTLYASSNDKALQVSSKLHGGYRRLGESGDGIVLMNGLDTVDASRVRTEMLGHSYYGDNETVMSDLFYVIRKSLKPEERERFSLERVRAAIGQYWRFRTP